MRSALWLAAAAAFATLGASDRPSIEQWEDGSDLETFVSRPDIRAPRLLVHKHAPQRIAPGHWHVTPYSHVDDQQVTQRREFTPGQTGAHIYDGDGNLVWSGAAWAGNRNIFGGFQPFTRDGEQYLSMIVPPKVLGEHIPEDQTLRSAVTLDRYLRTVRRVPLPQWPMLDFHEFNVLPGGRTALIITIQILDRPLNQDTRSVIEGGFQEVDLETGATLFSWVPTDNGVQLSETYDAAGTANTDHKSPWDYMHMNAVDKTPDGDYLVSGRHAHTVYRVSGKDGRIVWRLGGKHSDFVLDPGVAFYWQHHVRFHSQNETTTVLSLFDNSADDANRDPDFKPTPASGKVIALDTSARPMRARLVRRIGRPTGDDLSPKLGSLQVLGADAEHDDVLVNWAMQGYFSEHDAAGAPLVEARFQSPRMSSYRCHKAVFRGSPAAPPDLALRPARSPDALATALFVSWNGATDVAGWRFYGGKDANAVVLLGAAPRSGFETAFTVPGLLRVAFAEAVHANGTSLGRSRMVAVDPPSDGPFTAISPLLESPRAVAALQTSFVSRAFGLGLYGMAAWGAWCALGSVMVRMRGLDSRRRRGYKPLD